MDAFTTYEKAWSILCIYTYRFNTPENCKRLDLGFPPGIRYCHNTAVVIDCELFAFFPPLDCSKLLEQVV